MSLGHICRQENDKKSMDARSDQIDEMIVWVRDDLRPMKTEPIIVGGDMNVIHGSSEESKMLGPRRNLRFKGFNFFS